MIPNDFGNSDNNYISILMKNDQDHKTKKSRITDIPESILEFKGSL
jgi:hypothetical protein